MEKTAGFYYPSGRLLIFENWYQKCKPNAGWIKRYSEIQADQTKATAEAETILANIREYIRRSARKVTITRAFIKYGARRIATMLAIAAMIILSGFYWYDAEQKQNDRVINEVRSEMMSLMKSKEVGTNIKAFPLLIEERYKPGSMMLYLNGLDIKARLSMGIATYEQLMGIDKHDTSNLKSELINLVQANFKESIAKETDHVFLVTELNKFATLLSYDNYYNPDKATEKMLSDMVDDLYLQTSTFLKRNPYSRLRYPMNSIMVCSNGSHLVV